MKEAFVSGRVVLRGAGEMASGVIRRLVEAGYEVMALERPAPLCVRRRVCYAEAVFRGTATVARVTAVLAGSVEAAYANAAGGMVPILIDPEGAGMESLAPMAVVDARMLKQAVRTDLAEWPLVIGLGPGFTASENCHAAVETNRGDSLGQVLYRGSPQTDTGEPAGVDGFTYKRVLRSPRAGLFSARCEIADPVRAGQVVGEVDGAEVVSGIDGIVRGLIHDGLRVENKQKLGDIDPGGEREDCFRISDKADAIGRGVLEAIVELRRRLPAQ